MESDKLNFFEKADDGEIRKRQESFEQFLTSMPTEENLRDARPLLEEYAKIKPEDVIPHVVAVRNKAWAVEPYPCLGQFRFLALSIRKWPFYDEVLQRVKAGQKLLDLGCCFGQDLRRLVADGAPSTNLYGTDISISFFDLGYELFLDKSSFEATFVSGDFLADDYPLDKLTDRISIVYAASFIHLFDRPGQKKAIQRICSILKAQPDGMCFGRQIGDQFPGNYDLGGGRMMYRHNGDSFRELWEEVGRERGESWSIDAKLVFDDPNFQTKGGRGSENSGMLAFCVRRAS